jgi:hypothetical protein
MIHRSEIERRDPAEIAELLTAAFDRFCSTPALAPESGLPGVK